jgi:hypothetical protein
MLPAQASLTIGQTAEIGDEGRREDGLTAEREELTRLPRENRQLELERDH